MNRLDALERRLVALRGNEQLVTVTFKDGTTKTMPLQDVIPLLVVPVVETIEDVVGEPSPLMALICGILEEGVGSAD